MNCVAMVSNQKYVEYCKYLVQILRTDGHWRGDIVIISDNINEKAIKLFESKNVIIQRTIPADDCGFCLKFEVFRYLKQYDRVLYLDQDEIIFDRIEKLFDINDGILCADYGPFTMRGDFNFTKSPELCQKLELVLDLKKFCSGGFLFSPKEIPESSYEELIKVYNEVNSFHILDHMNTDESTLNIVFNKIATQIKGMSFIGCRKPEDIICHTTRWHAPWNITSNEQYEIYKKKVVDFEK